MKWKKKLSCLFFAMAISCSAVLSGAKAVDAAAEATPDYEQLGWRPTGRPPFIRT